MKKLIMKVKYTKILYKIYSFIGSIVIKCMSFFITPDPNKILFVSFGGKKYDDSPRIIFEKMCKDKRFDHIEKIWAFQEPKKFKVDGFNFKIIKIDTLSYYINLLQSKYWITNSSVERGLNISSKKNFCINTWHGTPLKKMGIDLSKENISIQKNKPLPVDIFITQSEYDSQCFQQAFLIPEDKIKKWGLPRNDDLGSKSLSDKIVIKENLNIDKDKKIILYAPTFREVEVRKRNKNYDFNIDIDLWRKQLGENYCLLIRGHYEISQFIKNKYSNDDFIIDVTDYENLNELLEISDCLVTDYSSIVFDYSILRKPIYLYQYDLSDYTQYRGLYFDISKMLPNYSNELTLLEAIVEKDYDITMVGNFNFKFIEEQGNACSKILNYLYYNLMKNEGES